MSEPTGQQLRDAGMQLAFNAVPPSTILDMETTFRMFCKELKASGSDTFRFEEYIDEARKRGWPLPKSPNAIGPFARKMMKDGVIEFTRLYTNAHSPQAHCRAVKIWRVV